MLEFCDMFCGFLLVCVNVISFRFRQKKRRILSEIDVCFAICLFVLTVIRLTCQHS